MQMEQRGTDCEILLPASWLLAEMLFIDSIQKEKKSPSSRLWEKIEMVIVNMESEEFEIDVEDTLGDNHVTKSAGDHSWLVRDRRPPVWSKDYVTTHACISNEHESCSYREACESKGASQWQVVMEEEMKSLSKNNTWELVELLRRLLAANGHSRLRKMMKGMLKDTSPLTCIRLCSKVKYRLYWNILAYRSFKYYSYSFEHDSNS